MAGRGKPRGQSRLRSQSDSAPARAETPQGQQLCGTCNVDVGDGAIGCDDCETWVHGTEMCSGLPRDVLEAIMKYDGHGIKFICMKCLLDKPQGKASASSGADKEFRETLQQLFQQFRGMCTVLTDLSSQVKSLTQGSSVAPQPAVSAQQSSEPGPSLQLSPDRTLIREELREMRERDKRRHSIIIRGLTATGPGDAISKFDQLTETQFGMKVDIAEVTQIPGHSKMFRAKIISDEQRKLILDNAKKLKGSTYSSIYISRDLTHAQRTELYEKRKARRDQLASVAGANTASGSSVAVDEGTGQHTPSAPSLPRGN